MKTRPPRPVHLTILTRPRPISTHTAAFTMAELILVIIMLAVFLPFCVHHFARAHQHSGPTCINDLKLIGTTYRIWANDHRDLYPWAAPCVEGGWRELLASSNCGPLCWTNYATMANELGQSANALVCQQDERKPTSGLDHLTNNLALSYFVGVNADQFHPQTILAGDRNIGPGAIPLDNYGYSPDDGQGNDVILKGPVCWSLKIHSANEGVDIGNILLADGSVQHVTSSDLRHKWLPDAATSGPIRLIFP